LPRPRISADFGRMEIAANSPSLRPGSATKKDPLKSRVANGSAILPNIDGRSAIARRYSECVRALVVDAGSADAISEARLQLIRRFAAAAVLAEQMEARLANGEMIDIGEHALLCSTLVRVAQRIGIDRRSRNITPTVADYVANLNTRKAAR
jgi:hypothetical protein